jgi:transposase
VDANGLVVVRRQLKRRYVLAFFEKLAPCLVGIEACASSHYWSRELQALGHNVRLMPPAYVKPYVKRQKNDTVEVNSSHVAYMSHPKETAKLIEEAATASVNQ